MNSDVLKEVSNHDLKIILDFKMVPCVRAVAELFFCLVFFNETKKSGSELPDRVFGGCLLNGIYVGNCQKQGNAQKIKLILMQKL